MRLRYDPQNGLSLCDEHHRWWHQEPSESMVWFRENYPKRYDYLVAIRNEIVKPDFTKIQKNLLALLGVKMDIERIAALEHDQWAGWAKWMMDHWDAVSPSGESYQDRWKRQMDTPYAELSEEEKDSDRREAMMVISLLKDIWGLG